MRRSVSLGGAEGVLFKSSGIKDIHSLPRLEPRAQTAKDRARAERQRRAKLREELREEDFSRCTEEITYLLGNGLQAQSKDFPKITNPTDEKQSEEDETKISAKITNPADEKKSEEAETKISEDV